MTDCVKRLFEKCEHFTGLCACLQKGDALPLWHKQPIRSRSLCIRQTLDWTQNSVRQCWVYGRLCPLQICDTEAWQGGCAWLWLQLNLLYKRSAAPGMALRYILYFSRANLSVLRWCPVASVATIMSMVSGVYPSDREWSSLTYGICHMSRPCLSVSPRQLWNHLSAVPMP